MNGPARGEAEEAARALASRLAPDLAAEVVADAVAEARAEARDLLRRHLVEALLRQAAGAPLSVGPPGASAAAGASEPAGAAEPSGAAERSGAAEPSVAPEPRLRIGPPVSGSTIRSPSEAGLYLYGITAGDPTGVGGLAGVDSAPTYPVVVGDLVAVASDVTGERHGWGLAEDGTVDLERLAPRVAEHERVLEAVARERSVLPMRFGVLYRSREAVVDVLTAHREQLRSTLSYVDDRDEWGLSVTWSPAALSGRAAGDVGEGGVAAADVAAGDGGAGRSGPDTSGRAYLARRAADTAAAERAAEVGAALADDLHRAAGSAAVAAVVHAGPAVSEDHGALLRASYLVERSARERFETAIRQRLEAGADLELAGELTGPWPPYNFARLDLEEVR